VDNSQEITMGLTCLWPWFDLMAGCMNLFYLDGMWMNHDPQE
jgi:hypothetical protein